jgi:hypothetical protein
MFRTSRFPVLLVVLFAFALIPSWCHAQWLNNGPDIYFNNGNVGIGTTEPLNTLDIWGEVTPGQFSYTNIQVTAPNVFPQQYGGEAQITFALQSTASGSSSVTGPWSYGTEGWNSKGTLMYDTYIFDNNTQIYNFAVDQNDNVYIGGYGYTVGTPPAIYAGINSNVGIGTVTPSQSLEVVGNVKVTGTAGTNGVIFPDGTTQTTAWTGAVCGGDFAESVDVDGNRTQYQPGDLLVLSEGVDTDVAMSTTPYSTMVAGIYATKPGIVGKRSTDQQKIKGQIPMAMVGIVPARVSAENGPIRRGDLLVSSSTPGYAMKGTDRSKMLGAVIGKAMGSLDSGTGVINVLVTLQ